MRAHTHTYINRVAANKLRQPFGRVAGLSSIMNPFCPRFVESSGQNSGVLWEDPQWFLSTVP